MKKTVLQVFKFIIFCSVLNMNAQEGDIVVVDLQISIDIPGEGADRFGSSVSINSSGKIIAIGAPDNDGNGSNSGHVRVYRELYESWGKLGGDIDGEAAGDLSGSSVSINSDGTIVAIGAPDNDGNGSNSGHVRVYQLISNTWTQLGGDIDGEAVDDEFGSSVSINSDGTIVAIGAKRNDDGGSSAGHVRVYQYSSGTWTQLGGDIDGESSGDLSGGSVSINCDGTVVAIGATGNDGGGSNAGHVRIYQYSAGTWTQLGGDIDGENLGDVSGGSVSINCDGTVVAIGATGNDDGGSNAGHVRIYQYTSGTWTQMGGDIDGDSGSKSGTSVSINSDGTIVAIGSPDGLGEISNAGHVKAYQYRYGTWTKLGGNMNGEDINDKFGTSVSINSDGTIVGIGDPESNVYGDTDTGYASIFMTMHKWTGATSSDWNTQVNWRVNAIPGLNPEVYIPKEVTNFLTLDIPFTSPSSTIIVESGASFISTNDFVTSNLMYRRNIPTTNWYLTAAPVTGLDVDDFVSNSSLATGTGNNIALGSYDNSIPGWTYYQNGTSNSDTFTPGVGYAIKRTSTGTLDYVGGMNLDDVTVAITRNANGFNSLGNPYPSYIAGNTGAANLLSTNTAILEETTIWLWNSSTASYEQKNLASAEFQIAPGQGFFVEAKSGGGNFQITEAMQSHQSTDSFQRTGTTSRPEIHVKASNESHSKSVDVYYITDTTTGFDNGYDSTIFGGVSSDFLVYTKHVNGEDDGNLGIQSLPNTDYENMVIPIGIKTEEGNLDFDISAVNFPSEIDLYLEDREKNIFTKIDGSIISITLDTGIEGVGRFYLHTTSEALSLNDAEKLNGIQIFSDDQRSIHFRGIEEEATAKVFSITGKQIVKRELTTEINQKIDLPRIVRGIYLVQLTNSKGTILKKIVLK